MLYSRVCKSLMISSVGRDWPDFGHVFDCEPEQFVPLLAIGGVVGAFVGYIYASVGC